MVSPSTGSPSTRIQRKGLSAGLGGSWESPQEYQSGITHGSGQRIADKNGNIIILRTPERYNFDLMLRYAFKIEDHDASIQLNVYNLLDDRKLYGLINAQPRMTRLEFAYKFSPDVSSVLCPALNVTRYGRAGARLKPKNPCRKPAFLPG